jgi:hypothetical protein
MNICNHFGPGAASPTSSIESVAPAVTLMIVPAAAHARATSASPRGHDRPEDPVGATMTGLLIV